MPLSLRHLALVLSIGMQATLCWAERTGPVVVGQTFMAGGLEPACDCSDPWALTSHGISEKLFTVDKDGNVVGHEPRKDEQRDVAEYLRHGRFARKVDAHCCCCCCLVVGDAAGAAFGSGL